MSGPGAVRTCPGPADPKEIDMAQGTRTPTTLYRCFNAAGELIYVGITDDLPNRLKRHRVRPWWGEVDRVKQRRYASRDEARREEVRLILRYLPAYNCCALSNAERARRGLRRVTVLRPVRTRRYRRRSDRPRFVAAHGYRVLDDGRVHIYGDVAGGWTVTQEQLDSALRAEIRARY